MVRKLIPFIVMLAVSAPLFAFHTEPVHRGLSAEALVDAMNRERAAAGLAPLRLNAKLSAAADDRMRDMFAKHYFDHVSPDGLDPFSWVDRRGYDYKEVGENLAVGYKTATSVVTGWMHSEHHRENVLGRDFEEIGIAIADGSPTRSFSAPTVVALYGTERPSSGAARHLLPASGAKELRH